MAGTENDYTSVTADIIDEYLPRPNKFPQLMESAARRNLPIPDVSQEQLDAYGKQHVSRSLRKREQVDTAHQRSATNLRQKADVSNEVQSSLGDAQPDLKIPIKRLGLEVAQRSKVEKQVRFADANEPVAPEKLSRIANRDRVASQLNNLARKELPQAVMKSAFQRQGYDADNPADVKKLTDRRAEERKAFTRAEQSAKEPSQKSTVERGYDERPQRGRSLSL